MRQKACPQTVGWEADSLVLDSAMFPLHRGLTGLRAEYRQVILAVRLAPVGSFADRQPHRCLRVPGLYIDCLSQSILCTLMGSRAQKYILSSVADLYGVR